MIERLFFLQTIIVLLLLAIKGSYQIALKKTKREFGEGWYHASDLPNHNEYLIPTAIPGADFSLEVNLPPVRASPPSLSINDHPEIAIISNSIEKPVMEQQEVPPPSSDGSAIIPEVPPPAIPVNAVAANVPNTRGAVFLGSGSLGVLSLGNGAYALGSGSLGYSENRIRPNPNAQAPRPPPIVASPNLIPAAVQSPNPYPSYIQNPAPGQPPLSVDQNGYEFLAPERVGFGMINPLTPPRLKVTQQFAAPTANRRSYPQYLSANFDYQFDQSFRHLG